MMPAVYIPLYPIVTAAIPVTGGVLHHIAEGMGDTGEGARVPQTLHTIDRGICVHDDGEPLRLAA